MSRVLLDTQSDNASGPVISVGYSNGWVRNDTPILSAAPTTPELKVPVAIPMRVMLAA